RLEGRVARGARGLRWNVDLRLTRSVLRRKAGDQDHRGRARRGRRLPWHLHGISLEQGASGRDSPKAQGSSLKAQSSINFQSTTRNGQPVGAIARRAEA